MLGVWPMARNMPLLTSSRVDSSMRAPHAHRRDAVLVVAQHFVQHVVPDDIDLRIVERPLLHDPRGPQLVAAVDQVDDRGELGQVGRLFDGRVAAADDDQRAFAEARQRAVADGTGTDAAVLELLFRGQAQVVRPGTGGHDHRVGFDRPGLPATITRNGR